MRDRLAVLIHHPTGNDDALADGQATFVEVEQQVVVVLGELQVREMRAGGLGDRLRDAHQRLARRTGNGSLVIGGKGFRMPVAVANGKAAVVLGRHGSLLL